MVAQHYISIEPMYRVIWEVAFLATGGVKRHLHSNSAFSANTGRSPNAVIMSGQRRRRWANIETVLGELHVFAGMQPLSIPVYSRPSEVVLGQRGRQFVGIEPAIGCDAGPTLSRNWVGGPTWCVRST